MKQKKAFLLHPGANTWVAEGEIMSESEMNQTRPAPTPEQQYVPAWKSPWVWGIVLGISTMIVVNVTMITMGTQTHPGLVVDDFYDKGKNYFENENKRKEDAARLGWVMELQIPDIPKMNNPQQYGIHVKGPDGNPLANAEVKLNAYRTNSSSKDFSVPLKYMGEGLYASDVAFTLPGKWDLIVAVSHGEDTLDVAKRISVEK